MNVSPVEWIISYQPVDYQEAMEKMEKRARDIRAGCASECVWLLEHPPLYTAGPQSFSSGSPPVNTPALALPFPLHQTNRGGKITYHGPGQRIMYVQLDLQKRQIDLRHYIIRLQEWIIQTLHYFNLTPHTHPDRIGVWIPGSQMPPPHQESKIAAIGVRLQKWVTLHGAALNLEPNLDHFRFITPCGLANYGVTSLKALNIETNYQFLDSLLKKTFYKVFC